MRYDELVKVLDVLTMVEIVKTGDRTIFKGKVKDSKPQDLTDLCVYRVIPCATSRETYLEIDVY